MSKVTTMAKCTVLFLSVVLGSKASSPADTVQVGHYEKYKQTRVTHPRRGGENKEKF